MCVNRWALIIGVVAAVVTAALPCLADAPTREYEVKAAFIFNFTQFIHWPDAAFASKDSPFVVATLGDDPFDGALEHAMAGKSVEQHPISVQHFASVDGVGPCQLLFVPATQDSSMKPLLAKLDSQPVLIVGESDDFSSIGGELRFFVEDQKMRFEINPDPIEAAGIKISAKLMKLARIYKKSA